MVKNKIEIYKLIENRSQQYFQGLKINNSEKRKKELTARLITAKQICLSLQTTKTVTYQHLNWFLKKGFINYIETPMKTKCVRYYLINLEKPFKI
jgi:hypothetical protein